MNINIQVLSTSIESKKGPKSTYQMLEVAFKNLDTGKVEAKKIMDFASKEVYSTLSVAKPTDVFVITSEKNDKSGYWDWTKATKGSAQSAVAPAGTRSTTSGVSTAPAKGNWETPEERARKQVYIIRQSSLSVATQALTASAKSGYQPTAEEIIGLAKQLEAYVLDSGGGADTVQEVVRGDIESIEEDLPF